ncbi:hypothetical protein DQ04_19321000 [Trypanosoma grayi]|uniref:hypothetical protein n=1 Tax=Trypanosoma grayi TaxID=71804 RepID=UPI0004F4A0CB|nr:hypothetical protein DQ04_19321000 [Trypanosoma grayi]KEG05686.1 hypothetical protein DQ04_19321000 [Trypanosoma grayi]
MSSSSPGTGNPVANSPSAAVADVAVPITAPLLRAFSMLGLLDFLLLLLPLTRSPKATRSARIRAISS